MWSCEGFGLPMRQLHEGIHCAWSPFQRGENFPGLDRFGLRASCKYWFERGTVSDRRERLQDFRSSKSIFAFSALILQGVLTG